MSKRLLTISTLVLLLISVAMVFLYLRSQSTLQQLRADNQNMTGQIEESVEKQRDAIIQRRISEQLENIAREQKNLTEEQTRFAIQQRTIAEARQAEAVKQRLKADSATTEAVNALNEAESQRQIAIEQKDIAELERLKSEAAEKRADTLRQLALSQALSIQASSQQEGGDSELAAMLATMGWNFAIQNEGDPYQPDLFGALKKSSEENMVLRGHTGYIRSLAVSGANQADFLVSASQEGEILGWKRNGEGFDQQEIFRDKAHDFRQVAINDDATYVAGGAMNGVILIISNPQASPESVPFSLTSAPISGLVFRGKTDLLYTDRNGVVGSIKLVEGYPHEYIYKHEKPVRAITLAENSRELILADDAGEVLSLDLETGQATRLLKLESTIGALAQSAGGTLAIGTEDGRINIFNRETRQTTELVGHLSMVNGLVFSGEVLLSVSYDQTVRLWNLDSSNSESLLVNRLDRWGYGLALLSNGTEVASAGADRTIRIDTIDPEVLAAKVRARVKRDFTREEWSQFIGEGNTYQSITGKR